MNETNLLGRKIQRFWNSKDNWVLFSFNNGIEKQLIQNIIATKRGIFNTNVELGFQQTSSYVSYELSTWTPAVF